MMGMIVGMAASSCAVSFENGAMRQKTLSLYYKGTEWERQEVLQLRGPLSAKTSGRDQRSGSGRYPIDQGIGCGADSQPR